MAHQMKFLVGVPLDVCKAFFTEATGMDPARLLMPKSAWERDGKPGQLSGLPVEPIEGRMMILEAEMP